MSTTISFPFTSGSWTNCAVAQLSMSTFTSVTGLKLPLSTRIAFLCSTSDGWRTSPFCPNITALVSPNLTRKSDMRRLSTVSKAGPEKRSMSISMRSGTRLSRSDSISFPRSFR